MATMSSSISCTRWANSAWVRAWASTVAAMAPADVAVTMSGVMRSIPTRYCSAPASKDPLVPPPARTNAVGPTVPSVMAPSLASPGHHCQPPAAAVTTSTWLPARTRVLGHSERGTTARSTATAIPLGSGPGRR